MEDYLTIKQLGAKFQCSEAAIRLWIRQGMPTKRFGRLVRFQLSGVLQWFEQREVQKQARRARERGQCAN